jgi:peptidoglycan/LPS O-acetylase OafA/YrhL
VKVAQESPAGTVPSGARQFSFRSVGDSFDPRHNSLNFIRLFLALMVVVSHTVTIGVYNRSVFGRLPAFATYNQTTLGTIAVFGFFGISGFLIAGSASRNNVGRYLWQRFLRIFPGFWVAIIFTAFFFSVLGWLSEGGALAHVSLEHYLFGNQGAANYVIHNWFLKMVQIYIYGAIWNPSLWTLFYEFLCYLILAALVVTGVMRRRALVAGVAAVFWGAQFIITFTPSLLNHFSFAHIVKDPEIVTQMYFIRFGAIFLTGAVLYLYRDKVPDSAWLAAGCFAIFAGGLLLPNAGIHPDWDFTASDLMVPVFAYPMIWLGMHLPFQRVGAKNDYSYGVYIYAYPVQLLLAIWGVTRWGYPAYLSLTVLGTIPFAVGSWWLIEKRALSLKKFEWNKVWVRMVGPPRRAVEPENRALEEASG